jgi:hypothetical protein
MSEIVLTHDTNPAHPSVTKPRWPDETSQRHYECWNCGKGTRYLLRGSATRFMCECGCGWSVRFGVVPDIEHAQFEFREAALARQLKGGLVDFTKPGALSSPA